MINKLIIHSTPKCVTYLITTAVVVILGLSSTHIRVLPLLTHISASCGSSILTDKPYTVTMQFMVGFSHATLQ